MRRHRRNRCLSPETQGTIDVRRSWGRTSFPGPIASCNSYSESAVSVARDQERTLPVILAPDLEVRTAVSTRKVEQARQ